MEQFYIQKIVAQGSGKTESVITFEPGLNIIQGHSNTGKTCIIRCIDYAFGSKLLPFDESFGYTAIEVTVQTPKGQIVIHRALNENKVYITTDIDDREDGFYDLKRSRKRAPILSDLLLYSIGITEPVEIIKNVRFERNRLSFRTFLHMFLLDADKIGQGQSVIEPFDNTQKTPFLSALLYLLTGEAMSETAVVTEKKIREARRKAVEEYVSTNIERATERRYELQQKLAAFDGINVENEIQSLIDALNATESEITEAMNQSKKILGEILSLREQTTECDLLLSRYKALRSQYVADVKRLSFIVDGENNYQHVPANTKCPFCDGNVPVRDRKSYIDSAKAELSRIMAQMDGLEKTEKQVHNEKNAFSEQLDNLTNQKDNIDLLIKTQLQPKANQLKESLAGYRTYIQLNNELQLLSHFADNWVDDLRNLPTAEAETKAEYHPKKLFGAEFYKQIDKNYMNILNECCYEPKPITARFDVQNFDVEIDNHKKQGYQGKGYCSFINTVTALVFRKYMYEHAMYNPGFFVIDTPLLGLDQGENDAAPESMRNALFTYFMNHQDEGQLIVIENLRNIPKLDYEASGANVITFTKDSGKGRYGFLMDVR